MRKLLETFVTLKKYSLHFHAVVIFSILFSSNVYATANDVITSTATINYDFGGVPAVSVAVSSFREDRIINFNVVESNGGLAVPVISDMPGAVMPFIVTNSGNAPLDFLVTSKSTSPNPFGLPATNQFPLGTPSVFVESGVQPGYQQTQDTDEFIDELAANQQRVVYIVANMDTLNLDDVIAMVLIAQVAEGGSPGVEGAFINADDNSRVSPGSTPPEHFSNGGTVMPTGTPGTIVDSPSTMETVFLDPAGLDSEDLSTAGVQDVAGNGQHSDAGAYQVMSPVNIIKSVVVEDTVGGTDPHPGAILHYQLIVSVTGNVAIDNLIITDTIPANTTYVDESIRLNGLVQTDEDNTAVDFSTAVPFPANPITSIEVDLGQVDTVAITPGTTNTINFDVTID